MIPSNDPPKIHSRKSLKVTFLRVESTFRPLTIGSRFFFVTILPKPKLKLKLPDFFASMDFGDAFGLVRSLLYLVNDWDTSENTQYQFTKGDQSDEKE